ncbi:MAG: hypothetical protein FD180_502 [Planctomycetota bacterium]|nr:MAG: hypothetical protein FD180_502 [Planctomycetota bacterium]
MSEKRDSFDVVKDLLESRHQGLLDMNVLRDARPHVEEVVRRLERLRAMSPAFAGVGFGESLYELVKELGIGKKQYRFPLLTRVAALL